jgi:hypothetical protein
MDFDDVSPTQSRKEKGESQRIPSLKGLKTPYTGANWQKHSTAIGKPLSERMRGQG